VSVFLEEDAPVIFDFAKEAFMRQRPLDMVVVFSLLEAVLAVRDDAFNATPRPIG
jgi:hypothetical protein